MARRFVFAGLLVPLIAALIGVGAGAASASKPEVQKTNHGHEFAAKGAKTLLGFGRNPNLTNHGGPTLTSSPASVQTIYWGAKWADTSFIADKFSGLDSFYGGWTGSAYSTTTQEYVGSTGQTSGIVNYAGAIVDTSPGPSSPPSTATILAEVQRRVSATVVVAHGYYPVYVDLKRGNAGYCAWHDTGTVWGVQVEVAFFFNLDGDPGCDPSDSTTGHTEGLAALANVSGHELSEAKTDPQLNAWYDRQGAENADKCAWHFNQISTFHNGTTWKIQGNWSNNAYNHNTGYYNGGCIDR
jgi:hypothetical protein